MALYFYKTINDNITDCSCERSTLLKFKKYFPLTTSPDLTYTIIITPNNDLPFEELTEKEAEKLHRQWEDAKETVEFGTKKRRKTERSLRDMYKNFWQRDFDQVLKEFYG